MTGFLVYVGVLTLVVLVICVDSHRRREAAQRRHPGNYTPEDAIEQAVAVIDDGKALVREAEDYLRRRAR